jgi:hypothetical protein
MGSVENKVAAFRTGLLLSLSDTRIHYRKHCSGKVTVARTPVQQSALALDTP